MTTQIEAPNEIALSPDEDGFSSVEIQDDDNEDTQWAVRMVGKLRCACGRLFRPYDFYLENNQIRLVCGGCHNEPFIIEREGRS